MSVVSLGDTRASTRPRDAADEKMDQIRDLLFGEFKQQSDVRLAALETRLHEFEATISQRLDAIHARVNALAGETQADRRTAFDELAKSVQDLADRIRQIPRA